jgi:CO/xanthine dehydrogenase FAD-binding subunit
MIMSVAALLQTQPEPTDSAAYKRHVAGVYARKAIAEAVRRAVG